LYRKTVNDDGEIIVPDYEATESKSAEEFANSGVLEKKYHYFSEWSVSKDNTEALTDKKKLSTIVRTS
jgi:hypothetical protein